MDDFYEKMNKGAGIRLLGAEPPSIGDVLASITLLVEKDLIYPDITCKEFTKAWYDLNPDTTINCFNLWHNLYCKPPIQDH
jgi:hypothetical protein